MVRINEGKYGSCCACARVCVCFDSSSKDLDNSTSYFIGLRINKQWLSNNTIEYSSAWSDGSQSTYRNWPANYSLYDQPLNTSYYTVITPYGYWVPANGSVVGYYICKKVAGKFKPQV